MSKSVTLWQDLGMITLTQAGAAALACVILIAVPGPSVMFVIGRALSYGRANALASVVGNATGCYLAGIAIVFGLGPLMERSELLFQMVKWAGVAYLLWLGIQAFRHAGPVSAPQVDLRRESSWEAIRTGTNVGVTNPKSFVLFTALIPQFINPAVGDTSSQILLLGVIPLLIGLLTDSVWAMVAGRAQRWLAKTPGRMTAVGRAGGLSMIGVGLSAAVAGNSH
ncbi:LysE family translocator [Paenarthrobacter sp. NPDC056912]|uniref:LysE family translocator n=1 Tax=Paenarthrobacter sp. NPDC056912 TaxID=3345965 RepID=UPI00366E6B10